MADERDEPEHDPYELRIPALDPLDQLVRDEVRAEWPGSPEHASTVKRTRNVALVVAVIVVAAWALRTSVELSAANRAEEMDLAKLEAADMSHLSVHGPSVVEVLTWGRVIYLPLGLLVSGILFCGYFYAFTYRAQLRRMAAQRRLAHLRADLRTAEADAISDDPALSLRGLWESTSKRLEIYHDMVTQQSQASFRHARQAISAGFAVLIIAAIVSAFSGSAAGALAAGTVGAVGAALGGYIGKTFLTMQASTTAQLRSYFDQPVEFFRLLALERLAITLDDTAHRAEATREIITSVLAHEWTAPSAEAPS